MQEVDTELEKKYVDPKDRVLDPSLIDKELNSNMGQLTTDDQQEFDKTE